MLPIDLSTILSLIPKKDISINFQASIFENKLTFAYNSTQNITLKKIRNSNNFNESLSTFTNN